MQSSISKNNVTRAARLVGCMKKAGLLGKTPMEGVKKWPYRSKLEIAF